MRYDPGPNMHDSERHTVKNGCMNDAIREGAVDYLCEQGPLYGECYATHIVRVLTKEGCNRLALSLYTKEHVWMILL
jgi:hypothetical protein